MTYTTHGLDPKLKEAIETAERFTVRIHGSRGPLIDVTKAQMAGTFSFYSSRQFEWERGDNYFTLWSVTEAKTT